jgi:hypothetical protein
MQEYEDDLYEIAMKKQRKRLWIDKYCSKSYLDLMSDDTSNRKVLLWMKSWDELVF